MNIVKEIKSRCNMLGISIYEVCRLANVPSETVISWEKQEPKTLQMVRKLGEHLGIDDPLKVLPYLREQKKGLWILSVKADVNYGNIKRWTKWKGTPRTIVILETIEKVLIEKSQESTSKTT